MVIVFASIFRHFEAEKQPAFPPQSASVWRHQNVWSSLGCQEEARVEFAFPVPAGWPSALNSVALPS